jgi:hypothetical protein
LCGAKYFFYEPLLALQNAPEGERRKEKEREGER